LKSPGDPAAKAGFSVSLYSKDGKTDLACVTVFLKQYK